MKNKRTRKILLSVLIMVISIFLFIDQCTTINLTTADLFRPPSFKKLKTVSAQPQSKNYEIVAAKGSFTVLYDRIQNEFYMANLQGLSKYDSLGNLMFSRNLE